MKILSLFILMIYLSACSAPSGKTEFPITVIGKNDGYCQYEDLTGHDFLVEITPADSCNLGDQVNINPAP